MQYPKRLPNLGIVALLVAGVLVLLLSAAMSWWQLAGAHAPKYVYAYRGLTAILAIVAAYSIFSKKRGPMLAALVGTIAFALPLVMVLMISSSDAASFSKALDQTGQAHLVWRSIASGELYPLLGWADNYVVIAPRIVTVRYSFMDGIETVSYFVKEGWFLALFGGAVMLTASMCWSRAEFSKFFVRYYRLMVAVVILIGLFVWAKPEYANYKLNRARIEMAQANYDAALSDYKAAIRWDHRLDYDPSVHNDLGRIYYSQHLLSAPDTWAYLADSYFSAGQSPQAFALYREHRADIDANPSIRLRYVTQLIGMGSVMFNTGLPNSAVNYWNKALELDPTNLTAQYFLAMGYTQCGQYQRALPIWRQVVRTNESVGLFRMKFFGAAIYRKPITAVAYRHMAWCWYKLGNQDLAMQCYAFSTQQGVTSLKDVGGANDTGS